MPRTSWRAGLIVVLALAVASAVGAEAVRLRVAGAVYSDAQNVGLKAPEGVGCGPKGRLVIADSGGGRLIDFATVGTVLTPKAELKFRELPYPTRTRISTKAEVFVLDAKVRRIGRISDAGTFAGYVTLGEEGRPAAAPRSFALDRADNLYVDDAASRRILVLDPAGKPLRAVTLPDELRFASDIAVDGRGNVFVLDSVGRRVFVVRKDAAAAVALSAPLPDEVEFPTSIAADESGRLFLLDEDGGGVAILGADGAFRSLQLGAGWKEGLLRAPADLCVAGATLFVADRANNRVQLFTIVQ